ncbi:MAG TPA: 3-oxoacyl-[acyl-carrier-protein] reductase [Planctomycetota bacterium]|nr:3-oxoacyl-[acyl-carrier-protein] reductase [Planctomycetota bacterium]
MDLKGKVSIITGGGRGIGFAIAETLADAGSDVALFDIVDADLDTASKALAGKGVKVETFKVNVADAEQVQKAVENVVETLGRIDVLVNNAGITRDGLLLSMTDEEWDLVLAVNLKGTFNMIRAAGRQMLRQRSGSIVNLASVSGIAGSAGQANYASSKAGVIGLTKTAAREFAKRGIRVNAVAPGFIETQMTAMLPDVVKQKYTEATPLRRAGQPADVAGAVLYFASDVSSFVTGQVLNVDGGMVMM